MRDLIPDHIRRLPKRAASSPPVAGEIRLDRNEQPYPPSPKVIEAIERAAQQANRYPESFSRELRSRLETYTGVPVDQIALAL